MANCRTATGEKWKSTVGGNPENGGFEIRQVDSADNFVGDFVSDDGTIRIPVTGVCTSQLILILMLTDTARFVYGGVRVTETRVEGKKLPIPVNVGLRETTQEALVAPDDWIAEKGTR